MNGKKAEYGSDVIVDLMKAYGIEYAAVNPGSSFRGLHDSIVNYGGNRNPEILLCCHEETAVCVAFGYARVKGKPMAAIVHDIVGLQHATMAIYNAWTSRVPVIVMGGTGPMNTAERRPGIDWVHTALVQGQQVRDYVKWDDQPAAVESFPESFARAYRLATLEPQGPVYLCYDVALQEQKLNKQIPMADFAGLPAPTSLQAPDDAFETTIEWLLRARDPLIVADGAGRNEAAFVALVQLAELLSMPVLDRGGRLNFPTRHPLNVSGLEKELLKQADLIFAVDVPEIGGVLTRVASKAKTIHVSLHELLIRSWSNDFDKLSRVDLPVLADSKIFLPELVRRLKGEAAQLGKLESTLDRRSTKVAKLRSKLQQSVERERRTQWDKTPVSSARLAVETADALKTENWVLVQSSPTFIERHFLDCRDFNQFAGKRRYGGVGAALPSSLGAALAFKGSGKICVGFQSDGDFLFGPSALWTAAHYEIPLLMIVFNNRSYYNDQEHQRIVAVERGRPVRNHTIGIRLENPNVSFARLAEAYEVRGFGPVNKPGGLGRVLREAVRYVKDKGRPAVVDVVTQNR
jgi:thiamine pyrophosphate-dependent acetolactate synthase large subunit-like protein